MQRTPQSRRDEFSVRIRKEAINKTKRDMRRAIQYNKLSANQIAVLFALPPKPSDNPYTFIEVLQCCRNQLLHPCLTQQMLSQCAEAPKPIPISEHIQFWLNYSQTLYQQSQTNTEALQSFLRHFLQANPQKCIHRNIHYQFHFLNILEIISSHHSRSLREQILKWVQGTEALRVIQSCLDRRFLPVSEYPNVYKLIELGLKSELKLESIEAAETLICLLREADWDDTYTVYLHFPGIATYLLCKIKMYCRLQDIPQFSQALLYLLDTFDKTIIDYTRSGAALAACDLILSRIDGNILKGMEMLRLITQVDKAELIDFLLTDRDVLESKLWEVFCNTQQLQRHRNLDVRKCYFTIVHQILANGQHEQIAEFASRWNDKRKPDKDLFSVLQDALVQEEEGVILTGVLQDLGMLLYYGEQFKTQGRGNAVLRVVLERDIIKLINQCQESQDRCVAEAAGELEKNVGFLVDGHQGETGE